MNGREFDPNPQCGHMGRKPESKNDFIGFDPTTNAAINAPGIIQAQFVNQAILAERERCAKLAETWYQWSTHRGYDAEEYACEDIAAKIRSEK